MKKKRMLIITIRNPYQTRGGASAWVLNIEPYLKQSFDLEYLILPAFWLNITFIPDRLKGVVQTFFKCLLSGRKYDYFFSHSPETSFIAVLFSKNVIHVAHGNTNPVQSPTFKVGKIFYGLYEYMLRVTIKKSLLFYTVGEEKPYAKTINQPINSEEKPLVPEKKRGFIFVGRLEAVKNIFRIIDIYNLLPENIRSEHSLSIYGQGTLENKLKDYASRTVAKDRIFFKGHINNKDLVKRTNESYLLIMASEFEGFPMTIAEALAMGTPVVGTDVGSINKVVKNGYNGFLISKEADNMLFVEAIVDILDDYETYSKNALESSTVFSPQEIYNQILTDIQKKNGEKKTKQRPKVLCIIQLPPPVHGVCIMNMYVQNSRLLNENFCMDTLALHYVKSGDDLGVISIRKLWLIIKYNVILLLKLLKNNYDLVYFTIVPCGISFYRDLLMVALIKIFPVKLVYHLHGKGIKDHYKKQKRIYDFAYKNVDVIVLANALKGDVFFLKNEPYTVNNGIEVRQKSFEIKQEERDITGLLYLSNFVKTKGVLDLLEATIILKNKGLKFHLQLIGQYRGELTESFFKEYINKNDLQNYVEIVGPVFGDEKDCYFANNDIFIFPTYNEAFSLVLLEAMQFGLPCISTYTGGIPEIIENNITGFLVEQRDIEDIANKLEILINDKELRIQMGEAGRKRFYERFTLELFEKNLANTFHKIIGK
ncbi:MAG: glycosyltransferase [Bacteroidales bacterium]|jgi:glycosyltransferase involved in cell wall biosynthesis|nr:glycosyltransferase [Bacteroidales bacterium]